MNSGGRSPPNFKGEVMELPISSKISEILNRIQISTVFSTVRTGTCVVCIVLKLQYYLGNYILFRCYLFRQ